MSSDLEQLCTSCARCCNGRLFPATALAAGEAQRFGCAELPQPCPKLGPDNRCRIYDSRPEACSGFLCDTAMRLERGELSLAEASATLSRSGRL